MKTVVRLLAASLLLLSTSRALGAAEFEQEGVSPGKWTMDLNAALKHAAEKKQAVLLNFTGSDWCGWCKLMEKNVFSQDAWKNYAKDKLVMVAIDFPQDKSLVPEKYVARNARLKEQYEVGGFPTYVLLDDDGKTVLGRLSAGREKTAESFIAEVRGLTRYRAAEVESYTKTLDAEGKAEYGEIVTKMTESRKAISDAKKAVSDAEKQIGELERAVEALKTRAAEFRAARLGPEKLKEYRDLKAKLQAAHQALRDWLATKPQRTAENTRKFTEMQAEIQKVSAKLDEF